MVSVPEWFQCTYTQTLQQLPEEWITANAILKLRIGPFWQHHSQCRHHHHKHRAVVIIVEGSTAMPTEPQHAIKSHMSSDVQQRQLLAAT